MPDKNLLDQLKEWGTTILSTATTIEEALYLQANGADIIIAQGLEAGGHRGMFLTDDLMTQMGTMALLPQIVEAVNIPVIATGGIANANCVKAAMTLGASGVQVGTSYLLCPEAKPVCCIDRQSFPMKLNTPLSLIFLRENLHGRL